MLAWGKVLLCRAIPPIFLHWRVLQCTSRENRKEANLLTRDYLLFGVCWHGLYGLEITDAGTERRAKLKRNTRSAFNLPVYKDSSTRRRSPGIAEQPRAGGGKKGFRAVRQQPLRFEAIGRKEIGLPAKNILIFMRVATSELIFRR